MSRKMVLRSVLLCDYVGRGNTGKVNAMGIHANIVICNMKPSFIDASIYANFDTEHGEDVQLEIRTKGPKASGVGSMTIEGNTSTFDIDIPMKGLVEKEGKIILEWRIAEGEWQSGAIWPVRFSKNVRELGEEEADQIRGLFRANVRAGNLLNQARLLSVGPNSELVPARLVDDALDQ